MTPAGFGVIGQFAKKILSGEAVHVFGKGDSVRDFVYIDDLVDGLFAISTAPSPESYAVCNIGSGQGVSLIELIQHLEDLTGRKAKTEYVPRRIFDLERSVLDVERMRLLFGWQPTVSLHVGLRRVVSHMKRGML
ncbi:hypothetical protein BK022_09905 [Methylorubrum extorquens]|uniref:NAD-dependent epimerase/dehydratase domain-containing protein n=1 Tax=Methylorubrum extorquens TaxID=408 RepID=A0A1S1P661_METEX|nr:hypothetical protein BK022_09905 [Methylorubrum extorquens]